MEIIAASVGKAGDFFLHAGYSSAFADASPELFAVFMIGLFTLSGAICLLHLLIRDPRIKLFVIAALIAIGMWMTGCNPPESG